MSGQYKSITPPKGSLRSAVTLTIVSHLETCGPCTQAAINSVLARIDGYGPCADPKRLTRVLHKLAEACHVHRVESGGEVLWAYGARPRNAQAVPEAAPPVAAAVPPARYNLMTATSYQSDPGPALRPGALDYKRVPTVGLRC